MKGASTEEFRVTTDEQRTTTKQDHSRQKFKPKNPDGSLCFLTRGGLGALMQMKSTSYSVLSSNLRRSERNIENISEEHCRAHQG